MHIEYSNAGEFDEPTNELMSDGLMCQHEQCQQDQGITTDMNQGTYRITSAYICILGLATQSNSR